MTNPADVIAAARTRVADRHPYLGAAIFSLRPAALPGLGTLAVDAGWRLYYDPDTATLWHNRQKPDNHDGVAAVVFHEIGHLLREHHRRTEGRDPRRANRAQDRAINPDVLAAGWRLPGEPLLPRQIRMKEGLLWEEYYEKEPGPKKIKAQVPGCGAPCGGCAGNPTQAEREASGASGPAALAPGEGLVTPPPLPDLEQQIVLLQVAQATLAHMKAHGKGSVPAGLAAWAELRLEPPKVDWRKRLAGLCRQSLAATAGACDFTWRRPGRRAIHSAGRAGWPLAPALHQPLPRVGCVLDTSGSMGCAEGDHTLEDLALSEVLGVARAAGANCWAVACDAEAYDIVRVRSAADLEKLNKGGGGTVLAPGFRALLPKRCSLVVIVTDGQVGQDWPSEAECRKVKTLAVLVGEQAPVPPAWVPYVRAE